MFDKIIEVGKNLFKWELRADPNTDTSSAESIFRQAKNGKDYYDSENINKNLKIKFFDVNSNKQKLIKELEQLKDFYFTQMMIERIINDSLNPSGSDSNLFSVTIKNSKGGIDENATQYAKNFIQTFNVDKLIVDIATDVLTYGEHFLRLDVSPYSNDKSAEKGIINIHDDVDTSKIVPVFKDSEISYFVKNEKNKKLIAEHPSKYVYFSMPSSRIKVNIQAEDDKVVYFKMGKPLIYPAFGLLKELKLFEEIMPIGFINNSLKTSLVSVSVPSTTSPSDAMEIAKAYETMINKALKIDVSENNNDDIVKKLSQQVGKVKVIPSYGDKGDIQTQELVDNQNFDDMFDKIADLRKMILITIGIPPSIIDESGSAKGDMIRENVRYTKKLKSIQNTLIDGLQRLILIHLVNSGFDNIYKSDIEIQFLNVLDTDDLEKLEYVDLMVSMFDNFKSFMEDFEDKDNVDVNFKGYIEFINDNFKNITGFDILKYKSDDEEE